MTPGRLLVPTRTFACTLPPTFLRAAPPPPLGVLQDVLVWEVTVVLPWKASYTYKYVLVGGRLDTPLYRCTVATRATGARWLGWAPSRADAVT